MIESGQIVESDHYDFKLSLNLEEERAKSRLVDDVVAFLNSGPGCIIVGVREKAGRFEAFNPMTGNQNQIGLRILSILQDNITPKPLYVCTEFIAVPGGFCSAIVIPEHLMRPYQNTITGSFYKRTGAKNTPLSRDTVQAMFASEERYEQELTRLAETEEGRLARRGIMQADGPVFHLNVLPREYFERTTPTFIRAENHTAIPRQPAGGAARL
jgi:predicted HTH transcriptional regulator